MYGDEYQELWGGKAYTFFHGTSWDNAQIIKRNKFRPSAHGQLGQGVYVARRDKAMRFAKNSARHDGSQGGLIELRILVKNPKYIRRADNSTACTRWIFDGHDACRAECTLASGNMEWCVSCSDMIEIVKVTRVELDGEDGHFNECGRAHSAA